MIRRGSAPITDQQMALWAAFLDCYGATKTRRAVDMFLRAVFGGPRD